MYWKAETLFCRQRSVLSQCHIQFWQLGHKEDRTPKNWCLWNVVLRRLLKAPFRQQEDSKKIKPVNFKGNQPCILIRRTDIEAEAPVFWSSDANSQLTGKVPDAGKDWGQKERRASEDEMAGWHHWCNGHELGQTLGEGEGQEAWHATVHGVSKSQAPLGN